MRNQRCCAWVFLAVTAAALPAGCRPQKQADWFRIELDATTRLRDAAENGTPQVRTKAIEALAKTEAQEAGPLMMHALQDPSSPVRFAAAMGVGEVRHQPARNLLLAMVKDPQTPPQLRCALLYALHRLGDDTYTTELGALLFDRNKWVQASAAMVMGRMGLPAAIGPLDELRRDSRDPVVQLQVVEALTALGDERAAWQLRSFTRSEFLEDRIIAVQGLGRVPNPGPGLVQFLQKILNSNDEDPAVRVAAADSLARLGERRDYEYLLRAALHPEQVLRAARRRNARILDAEVTNLQSLAILALGRMDNLEAATELHPLVFSTDGAVSVAACQAILELMKARRPEFGMTGREVPVPPVERPPAVPEVPVPPAEPAPPAVAPATQTGPAQPPPAPATEPAEALQPTTQPADAPTGPKGFRSAGAKD